MQRNNSSFSRPWLKSQNRPINVCLQLRVLLKLRIIFQTFYRALLVSVPARNTIHPCGCTVTCACNAAVTTCGGPEPFQLVDLSIAVDCHIETRQPLTRCLTCNHQRRRHLSCKQTVQLVTGAPSPMSVPIYRTHLKKRWLCTDGLLRL